MIHYVGAGNWRLGLGRGPGIHHRLRYPHGFGVGQRFVDAGQRIDALADVAPWHVRRMTLENCERTQEVAGLTPPAPSNLEMLPVDLPMRIDRRGPDVRVVSRNHVTTAITHQIETLFNGPCRTSRFDDDVEAFAVGVGARRVETFCRGRRPEVVDLVGTHAARQVQA
jgi:hypothetical protein